MKGDGGRWGRWAKGMEACVRCPSIQIPSIQIQSVQIPSVQIPSVRIPSVRIPSLTIEILTWRHPAKTIASTPTSAREAIEKAIDV